MKLEIITNNEIETQEVAKKLCKVLPVPSVVSLVGDLGAGKTTFTKGIADALEIEEMITSPTFTILNEYKNGHTPLYHFDMYRLESEGEAREVGFETYFDLKTLDGITIVEWAENVKGLLPKHHYVVTIEKLGEDKRKIIFEELKEEKKWKF